MRDPSSIRDDDQGSGGQATMPEMKDAAARMEEHIPDHGNGNDASQGLHDVAEDRRLMERLIMGVDKTECYSPVRIHKAAEKCNINLGCVFFIHGEWDFSQQEHRQKAWKGVLMEEPKVIIERHSA